MAETITYELSNGWLQRWTTKRTKPVWSVVEHDDEDYDYAVLAVWEDANTDQLAILKACNHWGNGSRVGDALVRQGILFMDHQYDWEGGKNFGWYAIV